MPHAIPPARPSAIRCRAEAFACERRPVRKAVFPAAGLGTRFLPATKAQPKEMLPLVDKPIIQYGVEEATAAGVDDIIIVTGRGKNAIEDHFDVSIELETFLESRGKRELAAEIRSISNLVKSVSYVRQGEPLGLGHAVLTARPLVGDEPFAVILADDVIDATPSALAQMIKVFDEVDGPVILVERIPKEPDLRLRRHRGRRRSGRACIAITRPGRETGARGRAVRPGHHRPLRAHAGHLRRARRRGRVGSLGRDSADERPETAPGDAGRSTPAR